jgi:hypothetical protein
MPKLPPLPRPGDRCQPDPRNAGPRPEHTIAAPDEDADIQAVKAWLEMRPIAHLLCTAVDDAVR